MPTENKNYQNYFILVSVGAHKASGFGGHQAEVYRHQLKVRPRKVPDSSGQARFHGTPQEAQGEGCRSGCICCSFNLKRFPACRIIGFISLHILLLSVQFGKNKFLTT